MKQSFEPHQRAAVSTPGRTGIGAEPRRVADQIPTPSTAQTLTECGRCYYLLELSKEAIGDQSRVLHAIRAQTLRLFKKRTRLSLFRASTHEEYMDGLSAVCNDHQIGLLVPALEPEVLLLAIYRPRFSSDRDGSTRVNPGDRCRLLRQTGDLQLSIGARSWDTAYFRPSRYRAEALLRGEITFPLPAYPRRRCGRKDSRRHTRIDIDHVAAVLRDKRVAIQKPDVAQFLADQSADHLESKISHRHRLISLSCPHPDLALDESADIASVELIDQIHPILLSARNPEIIYTDQRDRESAHATTLGAQKSRALSQR
jgi:hypothetical protein